MARVLIVDDEVQVAKFLHAVVMALPGHHECITVSEAEKAIHELERGNLDLVLLDLELADASSGRRLLTRYHHLLETANLRPVPVIIISGRIDEHEGLSLRKAYPFVRYAFQKPFDVDDLSIAMLDCLSHLPPGNR